MNFYEQTIEVIKNRQQAAVCTIVKTHGSTPRKEGSKMGVISENKIWGTIGGGNLEFQVIKEAIEVIKNQTPKLISYKLGEDLQMACGGAVDVYIEPLEIPNQLVIFGAGHIGKILSRYALEFAFDVVVIDDRENIFEGWDNTKFTLINESYDTAFGKIKFDEKTYVCSLTHAHSYDKEVAAFCCKQPKAYLGVISSRTKVAVIGKFLKEEHNISDEEIAKIDMPIGIDINCETPEEITISILAKLIDVKNEKKNK